MENNKLFEMTNKEEIKKAKQSVISIKGLIIPAIFTLALSFILAFIMLYKPIGSIEGVWVRQPDDNMYANGIVVRVENSNGVRTGEVIKIDDESAMPIGTFKWKNFQKDALNVFGYYDMSFSENPSERTYATGYALVSLDGKKLTIYNPGASFGRNQVWIKE